MKTRESTASAHRRRRSCCVSSEFIGHPPASSRGRGIDVWLLTIYLVANLTPAKSQVNRHKMDADLTRGLPLERVGTPRPASAGSLGWQRTFAVSAQGGARGDAGASYYGLATGTSRLDARLRRDEDRALAGRVGLLAVLRRRPCRAPPRARSRAAA